MYIVVKREDVAKYLTKDEISLLESLLNKINNGRITDNKELNSYYVCNKDEPYSKNVYKAIIDGVKINS